MSIVCGVNVDAAFGWKAEQEQSSFSAVALLLLSFLSVVVATLETRAPLIQYWNELGDVNDALLTQERRSPQLIEGKGRNDGPKGGLIK